MDDELEKLLDDLGIDYWDYEREFIFKIEY